MARRYYVCPVVTELQADGSTYVYAKVAHYVGQIKGYVAHIPSDPSTGLPLRNWALVCVEADDHSLLLADAAFEALPWKDALDDALTLPQAAKDKLAARGIDLSGITTMRQLVRAIGQRLHASFDERAFGVSS